MLYNYIMKSDTKMFTILAYGTIIILFVILIHNNFKSNIIEGNETRADSKSDSKSDYKPTCPLKVNYEDEPSYQSICNIADVERGTQPWKNITTKRKGHNVIIFNNLDICGNEQQIQAYLEAKIKTLRLEALSRIAWGGGGMNSLLDGPDGWAYQNNLSMLKDLKENINSLSSDTDDTIISEGEGVVAQKRMSLF